MKTSQVRKAVVPAVLDQVLRISKYGRSTTIRGLSSDLGIDDSIMERAVEALISKKLVTIVPLTKKRFIITAK